MKIALSEIWTYNKLSEIRNYHLFGNGFELETRIE